MTRTSSARVGPTSGPCSKACARRREQPSMTTVAAFDFDGTLTTRDTVVPFLEEVAGRAGLVGALLRHPGPLLGATVRRDRDRFKACAVRAVFTGRDAHAVERIGAS